jgi:hypothetical protein
MAPHDAGQCGHLGCPLLVKLRDVVGGADEDAVGVDCRADHDVDTASQASDLSPQHGIVGNEPGLLEERDCPTNLSRCVRSARCVEQTPGALLIGNGELG